MSWAYDKVSGNVTDRGFYTVNKPKPMFDTCPYDSSHQIIKERFDKHLAKCRYNYKVSQKSKKKEVPMIACRYNPKEFIPGPEILLHESGCKHRNSRIPNYLLLGAKQLKPQGFKTDVDFEVNLEDEEEERIMYEHLYVGTVIGSSTYGESISVGSIRYPKTTALLKAKELEERKKLEEQQRLEKNEEERVENLDVSGMTMLDDASEKPKNEGGNPNVSELVFFPADPQDCSTVNVKREDEYPTIAAVDDDGEVDEDFFKSTNKPTFNFMQPKISTDKPLIRYPTPTGLNKSERRRFAAWNSLLMDQVRKPLEGEAKASDLEVAGSSGTQKNM